MDKVKHFGKVYTPEEIVRQMIRPVFRETLMDTRICDPACGSGDFLAPLAEGICRRIASANEEEKPKLVATLRQLTGYDIDAAAVLRCRERLSDVTEAVLGRRYPTTFWRIKHSDALDEWAHDAESFDWVVGNPPYVRVQHLEADRRGKIKGAGWRYFRGAGDLYIVFYELGLRLLRDRGNLIFVASSGWLRNDAGKAMRQDLEANHGIVSIHDYRDHQMFPKRSTYICIAHIRKGETIKNAKAFRWNGKEFLNSYKLEKSDEIWSVVDPSEHQNRNRKPVRLRDIADIHVGIQTLADKVFILEVKSRGKGQVVCEVDGERIRLETGAVRKILKASVLKNGKDKIDRVAIYPYDGEGKLIDEKEFAKKFPLAYGWLLKNKDRLLARDKGTFDERKWHGYGREVGIRSAFGNKILTSGMNPEPNFQICDNPRTLFYSGYCIKPRIDIGLMELKNILNCREMDEHIRKVSQPFRGGWFSYAKRYLQQFEIPDSLIDA